MEYCIYTGADVPVSEMSVEHIVPKALGGADGFAIRVSSAANSKLGHEVDGAFANDFLMLFRRDRLDARGHSGKQPRPVVRRATLTDGRPAQVTLAKSGIEIWGARERRRLAGADIPDGRVSMNVNIGIDVPPRFLAKVALGAGYFAFGEWFRRCVRTQDLRHVVACDGSRDEPLPPSGMSLRLDCVHPTPRFEISDRGFYQDVCMLLGGSCVVFIPGKQGLLIIVGVLGEYLGFINVEADTTKFPWTGDFEKGHIIQMRDNRVLRYSVRAFEAALPGAQATATGPGRSPAG